MYSFLCFCCVNQHFFVYLHSENWLSGLKRLTETQVVLRGSGVRIPHSEHSIYYYIKQDTFLLFFHRIQFEINSK